MSPPPAAPSLAVVLTRSRSAEYLTRAGEPRGVDGSSIKLYIHTNWLDLFNGRFIIGNDYVRLYVTLVDSSWVVVAGVLTGVDFSVRTSSS